MILYIDGQSRLATRQWRTSHNARPVGHRERSLRHVSSMFSEHWMTCASTDVRSRPPNYAVVQYRYHRRWNPLIGGASSTLGRVRPPVRPLRHVRFRCTGQNNLFKYTTGLDPTNPSSAFGLSVAMVTTNFDVNGSLVASYPFSGDLTADASGNGHTGTAVGALHLPTTDLAIRVAPCTVTVLVDTFGPRN